MSLSEQKRHLLRNRLIEILGEEEAEILMDSLPPVYWHDLATKADLKATNETIEANKAAIEANKAAIEANKKAIEASEQRLRSEMQAGFAGIRTEMNGKFAQVEGEFTKFRGEMALQFAQQTRTMVFTMLAFAVPTWGSILAVGLT
ncbi:hypothetical protein [Candidatus Poriferisocius sp.]|uniref:hypothetical protein n=1 Tax=Candidatus Poriferisocius sp. TaxID=3101276 RepID=UPI003B0106F3